MKSKKIVFEGAHGDELAASIELPSRPIRSCAIFAHCFTCSKEVVTASRISKALANRGIAVLRFDFTGLGGSEGDFANTTFSSNVGDLVAAADFMRSNYDAPAILVGHSLGGAAVLRAAHEIDEVEAVVTIGAPFDPAHVKNLFGDDIDSIESSGSAEVEIAGRTFTVKREFIEDLRSSDATERIGELRRALLIFHSPVDEVVGVENARLIYDAARHPKSFITIDGADHLVRRREDADYVAEMLASWASRYAGTASEESKAVFDPLHEGEHDVVVRETGMGKFLNDVMVRQHRFLADEPEEYGGDDAGPTPYDYLLSALGACTTMTMRMYAERKGWKADRLEVHLKHQKVHASDCEDCIESSKEAGGKVDRIEKEIIIRGDLDDDQRRRIFEIAARCPVHRTLQTPTTIVSELADDA